MIPPDELASLYSKIRSANISDNRDNRRVEGNVVRASGQSPLADIDVTKIESVFVHLDEFIPENEKENEASIDKDSFNQAAIFNVEDETSMQLRLFRFLKGHGIDIPPLVDSDAKRTQANPTSSVVQRVSERAMSTLLDTYGSDCMEREPPRKLRRVSLGLEATTSFLCDVSVVAELEEREGYYGRELIVGELKHRDAYTLEECIGQAFLYMQTVLYWLRVTMGLPVVSVYGFAICGPKCKEVEAYVVTLLQVSAPEILGDPFVYNYHLLPAESLTDISPMATFIRFLRVGNRSMKNVKVSSCVPQDLRAPAYFALPIKYWGGSSEESPKEYELVLGGTTNIVFRATLPGVFELLRNTQYKKYEEPLAKLDRVPILERVKSFLTFGDRFMIGHKSAFPYVVKLHDVGVSNGVSSAFCRLDRGKLSKELRTTYPIDALTGDNNKSLYCLVMRNRGMPVTRDTFKRYNDVRSAFQCVWDAAMELCNVLPPCDALVHNIVYDGRDLHLIDLDEGSAPGVPIKKRIADEDGNGGLGKNLNYPGCLRYLYSQYTTVQLAVSFARIVAMNSDTEDGSKSDPAFGLLLRNMNELANVLAVDSREYFSKLPPTITAPVAKISSIMESWFQPPVAS